MSQKDQTMSNESESDATLRRVKQEVMPSSATPTFGEVSARDNHQFPFQVQVQTQATDGDSHGVPEARLDRASPSSNERGALQAQP